MLLPIKWLKDYCDVEVDTKTLADLLTDSGSHVEQIIDRDCEISGVYTGKITKIEKHPNADKLVVCDVSLGEYETVIVTGAPNVFEGAVVPVAVDGATLPDGVKIKASDFRGINSNGMLCSLEELGFDTSVIPRKYRDGIYIFSGDVKLGEDVRKVLDLDEDVIEFEITPNRPDCLSIVGMALETKATFDTNMKNKSINIENEEDDVRDFLKDVTIETENCNRYYARVLKDIKISESPQWMQNNLMAAGVRPINNIVDITNYIMLEYGLPLHAFDLEELRGREIKVYQAEDGFQFETLDGQMRTLSEDDIVIADGEGPIGIAGVMGGKESGVKDTTKTIVLEGANFNRSSIRYTSKRLNLRTEASSRFEKGLDPNQASVAVDRACELAEKTGAATVVKGAIDVYRNERKPISITLRPERCNMILGTDLSIDEMKNYLERLDIKTTIEDDKLKCVVPTIRGDITFEDDLIEEVGRLYGYNNIKSTPIVSELTRGGKPHFKVLSEKVKDVLKGMGYNELLTYSFISPSTYDKLNIPPDDERRENVKIMNPLGEEYSVMRTTLLGNMLDVMSRNQNRSIPEMLAYEIGNTFSPIRDKDGIPTEQLKLVIGLYGDVDFYYLKDTLIKMLKSIGIENITIKRETEDSIYHPGRCAKVFVGDDLLGTFGEVHPKVVENYRLKQRTVAGEFDFELMVEKSTSERIFKPLPKYPSSGRDLAIIVDRDIMISDIKEIIERNSDNLLEDFSVFDVYTGKQIEDGKKSIAFSTVFRSEEKTLTDEEVNTIMEKIISDLKKDLGAELRK